VPEPSEAVLKPIERTDRGRSRLHEALSIYRETILPEAQNPERQILYWIDHGKEALSDEFRCFALEDRGRVFGYLQYSYFREENVFFFEYLCLRDPKRTGLVPSKAVVAIENYLAKIYPPDFTIAFEVARKRGKDNAWKEDRKLVAYFTRLGFRKVEFDYRYPILQSYEGEVSYPADLMMRLPGGRKIVAASEMRTILRCIYFKHYLRWDRPFLDPTRFAERERLINQLYSQQTSKIEGNDTFGTSGDDKRSALVRFAQRAPLLGELVKHIFGPKLPRIIVVMASLLIAQWLLGNDWLLLPFVLAVGAIYCLAEDTEASRKLFLAIMSKLHIGKPRTS
jgi:hypothetical protein